MNKYELALIFNKNIDKKKHFLILNNIINYIINYNGTINKLIEYGRKKLAYEILKNTEGYYYFIQFHIKAIFLKEIKVKIRIIDDILRYLFIKQYK